MATASVPTDKGAVEGVDEGDVWVFKGIPFAAPPTGPLRWREPQPAAPWSGIRKADHLSPTCLQRGAYPEDSPPEAMSEDCLYLNLWIPKQAQLAPLPVMLWIHGGGLLNGSASNPLYSGGELSRHGVIVVTANYRLGALGFLAHPELSGESPHHVSGNYGLLDQLAALQWIQRNIAAFGGDPRNVTLFGQSSGSISISVLLASPLSRGMFRRAIGQSGGLFEPIEAAPDFSPGGAEQAGSAFAARQAAGSLAALRALPAAAIIAPHFTPQPVVDGYVLRESPYAALAHSRQQEVDVLLGSNAAEGIYFASGRVLSAATLDQELQADFPSVIVSLIGPSNPANDEAARAAFIAFEGNMRFGYDMWTWARLHAATGKGRTYLYRFLHAPPGSEGASHGAELRYVFDHPDPRFPDWTEADRRLAQAMGIYWTNFAKSGDPNGQTLPHWPQFEPRDERLLLIGQDIQAGALPNRVDLVAIDRLYGTVRILIEHGWAIATAAALVLLALASWLTVSLRRRRG